MMRQLSRRTSAALLILALLSGVSAIGAVASGVVSGNRLSGIGAAKSTDQGGNGGVTGSDQGANGSIASSDQGSNRSITGSDQGGNGSIAGSDQGGNGSIAGSDRGGNGGSSIGGGRSMALPTISLAPGAGPQAFGLAVNEASAYSSSGRTQTPISPPAPPGHPSARVTEIRVQISLGHRLSSSALAKEHSGVGPGTDLEAVDAIDNSHVWAAGQNCTLLFSSNGSVWQRDSHVPVTCTSGVTLTGISVLSNSGPGWVTGSGGTVLVCSSHCDASTATWHALGLNSAVNFRSVWAADASHVYAVGTSTRGAGEIWGCSRDCGAATAGTSSGDARWVNVTPHGLGSTRLNGIAGKAGTFVKAVGSSGTILICSTSTCSSSSSAWRRLTAGQGGKVPPGTATFHSVWATGVSTLYAVGSDATNGVIWACSRGCNKAKTGTAHAIWAAITPRALGKTVLSSVTGQGRNVAWAAGSGGAIWYCPNSCTSWVALSSPYPTRQNLLGVSSTGQSGFWGVGAAGTIVTTTQWGRMVERISLAIGDLGIALNPAFWSHKNHDGNHVDPVTGVSVLNYSEEAIDRLTAITTVEPAWAVTDLRHLDYAMRLIASTTIGDNSCHAKKKGQLKKANTALTNGDRQFYRADYDNAADYYESAWGYAVKAHGTTCPPGTISVTPLPDLFSLAKMEPGAHSSLPVTVTISGSPANRVSFRAQHLVSTTCGENGGHCPSGVGNGALANELKLTIRDTTTGLTLYAGKLSALPFFPSSLTLCAEGSTARTRSGSKVPWAAMESHTLTFTIAFPITGPKDNAFQGTGTSIQFVYERS